MFNSNVDNKINNTNTNVDKKINTNDEDFIENIKDLFNSKLDKKINNNNTNDELIENIRDLFSILDYEPVLIKSGFDNNYLEYMSNGNDSLSFNEYLELIKPYLYDLINVYKAKGEWKLQLSAEISFVSQKPDSNEIRIMYTRSTPEEIIIGCETEEVAENLIMQLLQKYQDNLQNKMNGSDFIFNGINYLYYHLNRITIDEWDKFNEKIIPGKESFYSNLTLENISETDYAHANNVFKIFNINNLGEFHDLYVRSDTLLLADTFENFRQSCLENYELDPVHFVSLPGLAWQACLKKTNVELELLTDYDMLLMVEERIRGGICHAIQRYAHANNKYMKDCDRKKKSFYIQYLDANNLYGKAMTEKLPVRGFRWMEDISKIDEDFV